MNRVIPQKPPRRKVKNPMNTIIEDTAENFDDDNNNNKEKVTSTNSNTNTQHNVGPSQYAAWIKHVRGDTTSNDSKVTTAENDILSKHAKKGMWVKVFPSPGVVGVANKSNTLPKITDSEKFRQEVNVIYDDLINSDQEVSLVVILRFILCLHFWV